MEKVLILFNPSANPFWGDDAEFEFDLNDEFREVVVEVWAKNKLVKDTLLGSFNLPKVSFEIDNRGHEA